MKFTPLDVRHQEFPTRLGSYDRGAVRAFLNELSDDLETLLQQHQALRDQITGLERQLEEQRQNEDEIRRAVVAAERISHELRENAARESDLMIAQASLQRDAIVRDAENRRSELESGHQARLAALEAAFRGRFADMEREHHELIRERERVQAERFAELERAFSERHAELTSRLTAARQEYTQFLSGYRALMSSFSDLSGRHVLPEETILPAPPMPGHASLSSAPPPVDHPADLPAGLTPDRADPEPLEAGPARLAAPDLTRHALVTPPGMTSAPLGDPPNDPPVSPAGGSAQRDGPSEPALRVEGQQFL
ncbi:DivIVA domain-containing protein [Deinococcus depolymerans]|uniref:DivIVA domain-containing protein n=1 Tax=Deinococcus depolymerans TaxID=392408 RepID=A0ABP3LEU0_9DEIO